MTWLGHVLLAVAIPIAVSAADQNVLQFKSYGFTIDTAGFLIQSIPTDTDARASGKEVARLSLPPTNGFAPNVIVLIQNCPPAGLAKFADVAKEYFRDNSITLLDSHFVSDSEWVLEYNTSSQGAVYHFYTRVLRKEDKLYLTTATATADQWTTLSAKLKSCVDSFLFLKPDNPTPASN